MATLDTGAMYSNLFPAWKRDWYEQALLATLRTQSILVPFLAFKQDFQARDTGTMIYSEVYDTSPNWNALSESTIWLTGAHLDSRSVQIQLEIHGDILKYSDYSEIVQFINSGNTDGLVREKIGRNLTEYLDLLAREAFMSHPTPIYAGGSKASRITVASTDYFNPDYAELARVHLEELDIPGVMDPSDGGADGAVVCITTPRVIYDIRNSAGSSWIDVQNYQQTGAKFRSEVGMWGGVRFIKTNRLWLRNYGAVGTETALNGATVVGQGAAATVDNVYTVGQSTSTRYVTVDSSAGFSVGDYVTIHAEATGSGNPPVETDGSQETARVVAVDSGGANRLTFAKPLMKAHADNALVVKGTPLHASIFLGGPTAVLGIGENPHPVNPPKYDDMMMINRVGWRGFMKAQMFRPEWGELHFTSGTVT